MKMLMEQIAALAAVCDEDEADFLEKLIVSAADYTRAVIRMKTKSLNYVKRRGEELRMVVEETDGERSNCHNALISYVDIVNRICDFHALPRIYTGPNVRREYGEFAIRLVNEVFDQR